MKYEELPDDIKRILPKNRFGSAYQVNKNLIRTQTNYSDDYDRWQLKDGKWKYVHPGTILK